MIVILDNPDMGIDFELDMELLDGVPYFSQKSILRALGYTQTYPNMPNTAKPRTQTIPRIYRGQRHRIYYSIKDIGNLLDALYVKFNEWAMAMSVTINRHFSQFMNHEDLD